MQLTHSLYHPKRQEENRFDPLPDQARSRPTHLSSIHLGTYSSGNVRCKVARGGEFVSAAADAVSCFASIVCACGNRVWRARMCSGYGIAGLSQGRVSRVLQLANPDAFVPAKGSSREFRQLTGSVYLLQG